MLKSEKGMSKLELVITVVSIMLIVACTIVLAIGEDGFSLLPENKEVVNNLNNEEENKVTQENTTNSNVENEVNDTVNNNIENEVDDTVYQGQ